MNSIITIADNSAALTYLAAARKTYSQEAIAAHLKFSARQVRRWERGEQLPPEHIAAELQKFLNFGVPTVAKGKFTFADLFAGIGGIRMAFEAIGGQCVFTSEWDSFAQKSYAMNFSTDHEMNSDITKIHADDIPDHDVLIGGFPCQPFSIAGVSKKNSLGKAHGFADETQGTLFFNVAQIIEKKRPRAFMLENVKNLKSHDKGRTFDIIYKTLTEKLGYYVTHRVIDGAHFVPQHRERIIIVGFRDDVGFDLDKLELPKKGDNLLRKILHAKSDEPFLEWDGSNYFDHSKKKVLDKYTLTDNLWLYLQNYKKKHSAAGNGFGFGLVTPESITRTLSARYYKDGSEILFNQGAKRNPRRLTPRECARLMGFPDTFKINVSDTRAYKQFGNSVVVPVMETVAEAMSPFILEEMSTSAVVNDVIGISKKNRYKK